MGAKFRWSKRIGQILMRAIASAAVLSVIPGCGVGTNENGCGFFDAECPTTGVPPITPPQPSAAIVRQVGTTLQVGDTEVFRVDWLRVNSPVIQWRRSSDGGISYVDISGASGDSYTLTPVQLSDDGTIFRVDIKGSGGVALSQTTQVTVSSMPPVTFEDSEFLTANWLVAATVSPLQNGPTHSEDRVPANGHPGAHRGMTHVMTTGPSSLSVFHTTPLATYYPATQGAIYLIDYRQECNVQVTLLDHNRLTSQLLVEQGGRKYTSEFAQACVSLNWAVLGFVNIGPSNLKLFEGPACGANESCPDFSASAPPLRFGYLRRSVFVEGALAQTLNHSIDNWRVSVWRR